MAFKFFNDNEPIIESLLDTDAYQDTVWNMIYAAGLADTRVKYAFTNRTKTVKLAHDVPIDALREQIAATRTVRFTTQETEFMRSQRFDNGATFFGNSWLKSLATFQLPELDIYANNDGQYELILPEQGWSWGKGIRWETFLLSIVSELRFQALVKREGISEETLIREGEARFLEKRALLNRAKRTIPNLNANGVPFMEFGTRRRPSRNWQEHIVEMLMEYDGAYQFLGTSNQRLAMKYDLRPMGTNSHQGPMIYSALYPDTAEGLAASQLQWLDDWFDCYGTDLGVFLPDAFGTPFCLNLMTERHARLGKGFRQDSGLPDLFVRRAIEFYKKFDVDTRSKLMIFSDGLNVEELIRLVSTYTPTFKSSGGWGTDLVFDFGPKIPIKPVSMVVKPVWANGRELAKLSDNPQKATGARHRVDHLMQITNFEALTENNMACVV